MRFLEVKLVGFDFNLLIALVVIYNFPIPSLVSFTIASLNAEYSGISTMDNSQREQQSTETQSLRPPSSSELQGSQSYG